MPQKTLSPKPLGRRIRNIRLKAGLSQEELAESQYTAAYISHIENGKRRASQEALAHIAARLGLSVEQLLSGRDPDEDLRLEVATRSAIVDLHAGHADRALESLEELRSTARRAGHDRAVEAAEAAIAAALFKLGRTDESLASCERALAMMADGPPHRRTSVLVLKARCLMHSDESRHAVHLLEGHLAELEREHPADPGALVEVYAALIPPCFETGLIRQASEAASRGWELASATPDLERRACLYVNRAQLMVAEGHRREAFAALALAEDLYRHLHWRAEVVKVALARSFVLVDAGELDQAEQLIRDALRDGGSDRLDQIRGLIRLAFIRRRLGDPAEALQFANEAIKLAGSSFPTSTAEAEREAALCLLDQGEEQRAAALLRKAQSKFVKARDHAETAQTARLLGDLMVRLGDQEKAIDVYRRGLAAMSELSI